MVSKYLVTGATGHLGSTVVSQLLQQNQSVRVLLLPNEQATFSQSVEICNGNICDIDSLAGFFTVEHPASVVVIHCAGLVSIKSKLDPILAAVNIGGTKNIVDYCARLGIGRLVYVSSVHAIAELPNHQVMSETNDFNPDKVVGGYAKSKAAATAYVMAAIKQGLNACVVHPSGIAGPNDNGHGHLTTLVEDYCHHQLFAGIDGGYDFVDVRDVAQGIISCATQGRTGECYILSNQFFFVKELLAMLYELTNLYKIKLIIPTWLIKLTAPMAELYYQIRRQTPLYTPYSVYTLSANANFSNQKAIDELGFRTRPMVETLRDTITWLQQQGRI
jgi:dihydroflavonol-4-reductase